MRWIALFAALTLWGCMSVDTATAVNLKRVAINNPMPEIPYPGKALVCFYSLPDLRLGTFIEQDGQRVGLIEQGDYFCLNPEPGRHVYRAKIAHSTEFELDVEAGERYYFKYWLGTGGWSTKPMFELMPEETARHSMASLQHIAMKP